MGKCPNPGSLGCPFIEVFKKWVSVQILVRFWRGAFLEVSGCSRGPVDAGVYSGTYPSGALIQRAVYRKWRLLILGEPQTLLQKRHNRAALFWKHMAA